MIDLRVQVNGTQQVEARLDLVSKHLSDFSPVFTDIKNSFIRYERKEFDTQGQYEGYGFAPLTPKYAAWKAKHFPGRRILELSGELRRSLTTGLNVVIRPTKLIMWSDSPIAGYHQGGTSKMPARKMVALTGTSEKKDWARWLQRFVIANEGLIRG